MHQRGEGDYRGEIRREHERRERSPGIELGGADPAPFDSILPLVQREELREAYPNRLQGRGMLGHDADPNGEELADRFRNLAT
ncbi:hypothetical protein GCM10011380_04920 [Sphingomonas metalli]|uniref:Uncharacterized protein n=1 Tax=Sphingomonas metalli TaxID=1779358 RepID=A0A916SVM1_9SPHN|nr:hypothetical protein GCM10011380_04920 [Sphingomonas metalli]